VNITLTLSPAQAELLWSQSCENFLTSQSNRFEYLENDVLPFGPEFDVGTMFWCETASDLLLLQAYERADGHNALVLWDLAIAEKAVADNYKGPIGAYVLLSGRKWKCSETAA